MKWVVVGVLVCLVRFGEGGASRCLPGVQDLSCTTGLDLEEPHQLAREESGSERTAEAECLAGSEWDSNCHRCSCSSAGVAVCVQQADCKQQVSADPIRCKPFTKFARDCNTCTCLENGDGLCTLVDCGRSAIPKKSELPEGRECVPGTHWRSQCNDCGCSPDGSSFCTEKACVGQASETLMRCLPDSLWRNKCNTCWCTSDGLPICTKIGCVDSIEIADTEGNSGNAKSSEADEKFESNYDQIENKPETIEEPDPNLDEYEDLENHYYKFENEDLVIAESHYNTQKQAIDYEGNDVAYDQNEIAYSHKLDRNDDSHSVFKRSVCKANQVFQSECNSCKCASDGQSYKCTQNECMEGETNKEVEVFMEDEGGDHIERHSVCKPRGTFYIGCNTCHCNLDGSDYSCTNKPCPLPEDVELFHELKEMKPIVPYISENGSIRNSSQKSEKMFGI